MLSLFYYTMASAPIMIGGLAIGLFFTFFGYKAQRLLVLASSLLSGGLVALSTAVYVQNPDALLLLLEEGYTLSQLFALIAPTPVGPALFINVVSFALGSLGLFFIARFDNRFSRALLAILSPLSVGVALLFTLRLFVGITISAVLATTFALLILAVSLFSVALYLAVESAIIAAMALSLLITRFWHLDRWIFYLLWAILALLGFLNQRQMIKAKEASDG